MDANITSALTDWAAGDRAALDRLAPAVYPQLRQLAGSLLRRERPGHPWQATILVNELFLKLIGQRGPQYENRQHFYNACARMMRMALIDHARSAMREKRGGARTFVPIHEDIAWLDSTSPMMLDLDRLLDELAALDPEQVAMFETRYLLGCTAEETASLFNTSKASVDRKIRVARAWLYQRLGGAANGDSLAAS